MLAQLVMASSLAFVVQPPADPDPCLFARPTVPVAGLTPADTGARQVFDPDSYGGTDCVRLQLAMNAADAVDGAVRMTRFYETTGCTVSVAAGVMVTGGGIRRGCFTAQALTAPAGSSDTCVTVPTPSAYSVGWVVYVYYGTGEDQNRGAFTVSSVTGTQVCKGSALGFTASAGDVLGPENTLLTTTSGASLDNIVIDSVAFDGNSDCVTYTHDWKRLNSLVIRGDSTVRNSYFFDTPSENMTICGGTFTSNTAWNLGGGFVHKSCADPGFVDTLTGNLVDGANEYTDAVMGHSEGVFTFSANAGNVRSSGNKYLNGSEAVWGNGSTETEVRAWGDCYSHFPRLLGMVAGYSTDGFNFDARLFYVPEKGRQ